MTNPFDKTFFKLVLGFTIILTLSFAVLFFVGKYGPSFKEQNYAAIKDAPILNK